MNLNRLLSTLVLGSGFLILALVAILGVKSVSPAYAGTPGTVINHTKIADNTGGFGSLADNDWLGTSVASIGDLNGDGITDLAVGAYGDNTGGIMRGAVYIFIMKADGTISMSQKIADNTGGFGTLSDGDIFGSSITAVDDLNGDGITDLVVGAALDDTGGGVNANRGAIYVLFMKSDGTVSMTQKIAHNTGGFGLLADGDAFGNALSSVGDLNGDNIHDLAVGALRDDTGGNDRGAVYLLYMKSDGTVSTTQKIANSTGGLGLLADEDFFGSSVASVDDLDGDSIPDLAVGAMGDDTGGSDSGAIYVLFMKADNTVSNTQKVTHQLGGFGTLKAGDNFGNSLSSIDDLNRDGITDIVVGAYLDDAGGSDIECGAIYVLLMKSNGTVSTTQKITHNTGNFGALAIEDFFGASVASIGDLNKDSIADLAVGAYGDDTGGDMRGATYVLFLDGEGTALPDLALSKNVSPSVATTGQTITYTLTFTNVDEGIATGVTITDTVPLTLTNVTVTSSGVIITDTGTRPGYVWQVQDLVQNQKGIITITGQISSELARAGFFTNTAEITSANEYVRSNNQAAVGIEVVFFDLAVNKAAAHTTTTLDNIITITYVVGVHNIGALVAKDVIVSDTLPLSITFISSSTTNNSSYDYTAGIWDVGEIVNSTGVTLTLVTTGNLEPNQIVTNTAILSECTPTDTNTDNNKKTVSIIIGTDRRYTYLPIILK